MHQHHIPHTEIVYHHRHLKWWQGQAAPAWGDAFGRAETECRAMACRQGRDRRRTFAIAGTTDGLTGTPTALEVLHDARKRACEASDKAAGMKGSVGSVG